MDLDPTDEGYHPNSRHDVIIDNEPAIIFLAGGGCSTIGGWSATS